MRTALPYDPRHYSRKWHPAAEMPEWASRFHLQVIGVDLQGIEVRSIVRYQTVKASPTRASDRKGGKVAAAIHFALKQAVKVAIPLLKTLFPLPAMLLGNVDLNVAIMGLRAFFNPDRLSPQEALATIRTHVLGELPIDRHAPVWNAIGRVIGEMQDPRRARTEKLLDQRRHWSATLADQLTRESPTLRASLEGTP